MKLSYHDAIYPARLARNWTEDESTAYWAGVLITGGLVQFPPMAGEPPRPNKSARIYSRRKISPSEEVVTVQASHAFLREVREWLNAAEAAEAAKYAEYERTIHANVPQSADEAWG